MSPLYPNTKLREHVSGLRNYWSGLGIILILAATGSMSSAQTTLTWNNGSSDFTSGTAWTGGMAPADDSTSHVGSFGSVTVQPSLGSNRSIAGLEFTGSDDVTLSGSSTLTTGASGISNSSTSGTKIISPNVTLGAAQNFANAGVLTLAGTVDNGGNLLTLSGTGQNGVISGQLSGSGGLTKSGSGRWTLTNTNGYAGPITVSDGVLAISSFTTPTGTLQIDSGAETRLNTSNPNTFYQGAVTGDGTLQVNSQVNGSIFFTENSSFSGQVNVIGNTSLLLGFGNADGAIDADINLVSTSDLRFNRTTDYDYGGNITGDGQIYKLGSNVLTLSGTNSFTGGTTIGRGLVEFGSLANFGTGNITLDGGGMRWATGTSIDVTGRLNAIGSGGGTFDTNGNEVILAGPLAGTGSVTKSGSGNLTLTANNSYSGGTTISAGTLTLGTDGTTGSINGAISNAGTLVINRSDDLVFGSAISGTGAISKLGTNNLTLTGAISSTGGISFTGGSVQIGNGNTIADFTGDISNGGNLTFNHANAATFSGNQTGTGSFIKLGTGNLTVLGLHQMVGGTTVSAGTLTLGNGANLGIVQGNIVNNSAVVSNADDDGAFSGTMSGTGFFTKLGAGNLQVITDHTFTGGTTISAGTLSVGSGTNGSIVGDIVNNASIIFQRTDNFTFGGDTSGSGNFTKTGPGQLILTGDNTFTGATSILGGSLSIGNGGTTGTFTSDVDSAGELIFNRSDDVTYGGNLTGTGSLTKQGAGTLLLTGTNTFSGALDIQTGTLAINADASLGSTGAISLDGTTLQGNASFTTARPLTLEAGNGSVAATGGATLTLNGVISGTGGLLKTGVGTVALTGTNTYGGATTVSAGVLEFSSADNFGIGDITLNGGGLRWASGTTTDISANLASLDTANTPFDTNGNDVTLASVLAGSGSIIKQGTGTLSITGSTTLTGGVRATAGTLQLGSLGNLGPGNLTLNDATLQWASGSTADFSSRLNDLGAAGAIFDTNGNTINLASAIGGTGDLTKSGAGILSLSADNTYTGDTFVTAGTLRLGTAAALPSSTALDVAAGATFDLNTFSPSFGGITGSGDVDLGSGTLDLGGDDSSATFAGTLTGGGNLIKSGTGTLTFDSANTYSGLTTVNAGTLAVTHASALGATSSGTVVNSGASLSLSDLTLDAEPITINGTGVGGVGALIAAGTVNLSSNLVLGGDASIGGAGTLNLSGVLGESSGFPSITKVGTGTLNLTGLNGHSGETIIDGGTLIAGNANALGAPSRGTTVNSGGTLEFTNAGFGTETITMNGGTMRWGSGATIDVSTSLGAIGLSGAHFNTNGNNVAFSSPISGDGGINKTGAGTLTLNTAATFAGGVSITGGTLAIGTGNALPTTADVAIGGGNVLDLNGHDTTVDIITSTGSVVTDGGILTVGNNNGSGTFSGVISGSGAIIKIGSGTLVLNKNQTLTGTSTVSDGILQLGAGGTTGHINASIVNNSRVHFNLSQFGQTHSGDISGSGNVSFSGHLTLTGTNTYSGTTSGNGFLTIGNGGTLGSLTGNIVMSGSGSGVIDFRRSNTHTYAGVISNGGFHVDNAGAGTLILTGNNSATAELRLDSGNVQIGNGGTSGSWNGNIRNNRALTFDRSDDSAFNRIIHGTGTLTKLGAGQLTLTNTNTFSGTTTISEGSLRLGTGGFITNSDFINNATLEFSNSTNPTVDRPISGSGNVIKSGAGTLTLSGANTYEGGTSLNNGTLLIDSDVRLGDSSGSVAFNGGILRTSASFANDRATALSGTGGTFNVDDATTLTWNGDISGASTGLTKSGTGTFELGGTNTYAGSTTVSAGILSLGSNDALPSDTHLVLSAGVTFQNNNRDVAIGQLTSAIDLALGSGNLTVAPNTDGSFGGIFSGTGRFIQNGDSPFTLSGNNTYSGGTEFNNGTIRVSTDANLGTGVLAFNGGTLQTTASFTNTHNATLGTHGGVISPDTGTTLTWTGDIAGGALTKMGDGDLALNGTNTFTGSTSVFGGRLLIDSDADLSSSSNILLDGGSLGASSTFTSNLNLALGENGGGWHVADGVNLTYTGSISGDDSPTFTKSGDGELTFTTAFTPPGGFTIDAGTVNLGNGGNTGSVAAEISNNGILNFNRSTALDFENGIAGTGRIKHTGTGTLTLSGTNTHTGGMELAGGTVQISADSGLGESDGAITFSGGTLDITSGTTSNRATTLSTGGGTINLTASLNTTTWNGDITGAADRHLTKTGAGVLVLGGNNTYAGNTIINAGTLRLVSTTGIATSNRVQLASEATLDLNGIDVTLNDLQGTGAVTLGGADLTLSPSTNQTFGGGIMGTGTLIKAGANVLTLSGSNTYAGDTFVNAGTLRMGSINSLSPNTTLRVAPGATFNPNGFAQTVANLGGTGDIDVGSGGLNVNPAGTNTFTGRLTGNGGLTKGGTGLLELTGTHTFTGPTAINSGRLRLTGSAANSAFAINNGGTLSGTGTLGSLFVNTGGILSPGNSPGTLSAGDTVWAGDASFIFEIDNATGNQGSNWDLLAISGTLTVNATMANPFTINVHTLVNGTSSAGAMANFDANTSDSWTFVTTSGGISFGTHASIGASFAINTDDFANTTNGTFSLAHVGDNLALNYTTSAVPEPRSFTILAGLFALGFTATRRRPCHTIL